MADIDGYLNQIKSAESGETVRDAIINCLRDINRDVPMVEEDWEGYMPESTDLTLSGHYKSVHVMHNPSSGKATKLTTLHVTENDTYEPEGENEYYNKVVVEVDQSPYTIKEEAVEITQNGTYYAKEDFGVNGLAEIHVNVVASSSDGPFQVEFYDKVQTDPSAKAIQTVMVPYGGRAEFNPSSGYPVSQTGQVFTGWNPDPSVVTRDMKCYPKFGDRTITIGEIGDDWSVILAKRGEGYPLGSYKTLGYGAQFTKKELADCWAPYSIDNPTFNNLDDEEIIGMTVNFLMVKVAEGESGTKSTWISSPIPVKNQNEQGGSWDFRDSLMRLPQGNGAANYDYRQYIGRYFLNGPFYNHMVDAFKDAIKAVTKYTQYATSAVEPFDVVPTPEYIWIPSVKEMYATDMTITCCSSSEADMHKYVEAVPQAVSYFHDSIPSTTAEVNALLLANSRELRLRDVTDSKDGPWGGWRTPTISFNNQNIYNEGAGRGHKGWMDTPFVLGFCMG